MEHWKRKFTLLGIGQAVSILSSSILQIAIVWHLTQRTGSAAVVTMSTLSGYLPRAVLGLFTGAFIDRYSRKLIIILSDALIALAALALAAASLADEPPIPFIFAILFVRSVGAAFHGPALGAIIPTVVPKEQLARCSGFLQGFESVSLLLSPALTAILFTVWRLGHIVLLDVAGAAVAVLIVLFLRLPKSAREGSGERVRLWRDTKEGFAVVRARRGMTALLVISTLYAFIYFPIGSMYPLITMTYFGGTVADSGLVEIAFSGGTLLGALLLGWLGNRLSKAPAIAASIGVYGAGAMLTGLLAPAQLRAFTALSVVMGVTIPFFYGLRIAVFQSRVPNEYLGRVLSLMGSVSLFAGPLGLTLGGVFSDTAGVERCFFYSGTLAVCLAAVILAVPSVRNCCDA